MGLMGMVYGSVDHWPTCDVVEGILLGVGVGEGGGAGAGGGSELAEPGDEAPPPQPISAHSARDKTD